MNKTILMKIFSILGIFYLLFNTDNQGVINKIQLDYVNLYITSFKRIESNNFESSFKSIKKRKIIKDSSLIKKFKHLINNTLSSGEKIGSLDVRFRLQIKFDDGMHIFFGSINGIEINNAKYKISKDFQKFLIQITESKYR